MTPEAYAKIRGLSDAALVCVYRSTFVVTSKSERSLGIIRDALRAEIRSRPHIEIDENGNVSGYDAEDGFGTLRGG